jgi:hypothetical protein
VPSAVLRYWRASSLAARRQTLLFEVKRDNIDEKVKDFMARSDELVFVLRQQEALAAAAQGWGVTGALALGVVRRSAVWRKVVPGLGLAINALLVLGSTSAGSTYARRSP